MLWELGVAARTRLRALFGRLAGEGGASAVEYGLLVALIAGVIIIVVAYLGSHVSALYSSTAAVYP